MMSAGGGYDQVFRAFEENRDGARHAHLPRARSSPIRSGTDTSPPRVSCSPGPGTDSQTFSFIHEMQVWLAQVLLTGFLDRYPQLKMAVFESNAEWLPYTLDTCDRLFQLYANERRAQAETGSRPRRSTSSA